MTMAKRRRDFGSGNLLSLREFNFHAAKWLSQLRPTPGRLNAKSRTNTTEPSCAPASHRSSSCPTTTSAHPYAVTMEGAMLEPNAQVSIYPWKDVPEKIPLAVRHIRTFLQANRSVTAAVEQRAAAE